ncbi:MAG: cytochrome c maturation protein CcmE [Deltaproteobacteria bacterium]|nr:cytochrome c maturation protein CcmE [Deltaproteobacteria bacterium]
MNRKHIQLAKVFGGVALIAGTLTYLVSNSLSGQVDYFYPADELAAKTSELSGQKIRVGGKVVTGSILQKTGTLEYAFRVKPHPGMIKPEYAQFSSFELPVTYTGVIPDTFKDDADVVVTGRLGPNGTFVGQDVLAKCPSKDMGYKAKN